MTTHAHNLRLPDSRYSWMRLFISLAISTIGGIGLWSTVVVLPAIETEFGVGRGGASLPYMATMIGAAFGGIAMGSLADRVGIMKPLILSAVFLCIGFTVAAWTGSYWQFIITQAVLIGMLGSSTTFGPLVADASLWFVKKRGLAIGIVASGNYLSGAIWPPILQHAVNSYGWRNTYIGIGIFCVVTMLPLALMLRERAHIDHSGDSTSGRPVISAPRKAPAYLQWLLLLAGLSCCIAMSMPQVHIVAYCGDLGYGTARGAEMLSIILGMGVVSRLISGFIADRIGGAGTLILGSTLQCLALMFYLPFNGLTSLYIVSAFFGLAQGGIVPSYALIVRDYYPAREAGRRISLVLTATVMGMAAGGWISGVLFDMTGSYQAAFLNGIAWNLINMSIAAWLLFDRTRLRARLAV
ncbi:MAG: MFS transporter [Hyphomicrobiales bacterium]